MLKMRRRPQQAVKAERSHQKQLEHKDKIESGEYVLSRPPKNPGGEEINDAAIAATISQVPTTTLCTSPKRPLIV